MLTAMDNKTWLVEVAVAACIMAGAAVAFSLLVGHTLWMSLARKQAFSRHGGG
jgi:hypothetical protein